MEVKTGEVKAMANFSRRSAEQFVSDYNYAVASQGVLEPGSTFKLATMLALLDRSTLQLTDSIETGGGQFSFYGSLMRDDEERGTLTAAEAFEYSSNIGIARLAVEHFGDRPEVYTSYLKNKLHLHEPFGFQLKGEGRSYIKTIADTSWSATSLAWMSHGYELRIAPLHLLAIYNAVANKGRMMAPLLVKSIRREDKIVEQFKTRVIEEEIARAETIAQVQGLLEGVVLRGTARTIRSPYYRIAGKTGTAKQYNNGRYIERYRASFVGYFPSDDPQYSCLVLVSNPRRGGIHGAEVAAPVFRQIADRICRRGMRFSNLRMADDMPRIGGGMHQDIKLLCDRLSIPYMDAKDDTWVRTVNAGGRVAFRSAMKPGQMPDLQGMLLRDALYMTENAGLKVRRRGKGPRVGSQYPPPFRRIESGTDVILTLR